jgi:predicted Zn-dependent peptidase
MATAELKKKAVINKHIIDRSKPPKSGKPKDVNFPDFFESKTQNGITVIVICDKRFPLVSSRFVFKSGAYIEHFLGKNKYGLGSITSEIITKGTTGRTASEIAEEVDYLGAGLSSGCNFDATYVSSYSLKKYFDSIFDIMSDVILNPSFKEEELVRLKEQRINSLLSMIDDGDYLADKIFSKFVYGNSPYAFPVEGEKDSITGLTCAGLKKFYKTVFSPENLIVAFVGDITPDEALKKLNGNFSSWKKTPENNLKLNVTAPKEAKGVYITEKKGAVQSSLKIGHLGIKRSNPDFIKVGVMNTILGGYFTSRINKNLREVNGYTYGARSHFNSYKRAGDFSVTTEVKTEITGDTLKEILKEINQMRTDLVGKNELQNVKNYISGNFPLQLETPNEIASKVLSLKLHNLENDYYNTYLHKVNEITREDILEIAQKYLHPEKLVYSVAGNSEELKKLLGKFGKIKVTDEINL